MRSLPRFHFFACVLLIGLLVVQCGSASKNSNKSPVDAGDSAAVMVYVTPTGKKYHREDCGTMRKSKTALTMNEAVERGYGACKVCNPPVINSTGK